MKKLKRIITLAAATALLLVRFTACGTDAAENKESTDNNEAVESGKLKELNFAVPGQDDNFSAEILNLAIKNGYLEEELNEVGFTLKYTSFMSGTEINEAIAGGSAVGGELGDVPAIIGESNGVDTKVVALTNNTLQYGIVASNNVKINSPSDFEGKKVIVAQGTVLQYFWDHYVKENGIDTSKIETINSTDPSSLLTTGDADAYVTTLLSAYYFEQLGIGKVVVDGSKENGVTSTTVVEFKTSFLEENPDVAVAFNKALVRAYDEATQNPQSFYESLATENQPADVVKLGYEWNESLTQLDPAITEQATESYKALSDWLQEQGYMASGIDVSQFVDTSYYEKAVEELD